MIYHVGVHLRNRAFDAGFMSVRGLARPTVSVGNLTMGGTGKTPFVIYLAGLIKEIGCEAAVLTRGYGRRKFEKTIIVPPGKKMDNSASRLGDEPALVHRRLPEVWLGISSDRFIAANAIARRAEFEKQASRLVFILDDGFQRRDIHRDLDIIMVDPAQPPDAERLFPRGGLREPVSELRRAHVVVINGTGSSGAAGSRTVCVDTITDNLRKYAPEADFFQCNQRIQTIIPFSAWLDSHTPRHLHAHTPPKTAFLAAAIGNPGRFRQDITDLGVETPGSVFFRDHAVIGKKDWEACAGAARKAKAEAIIITEKDAVKISSPPDFPLLVAVQNTELPDAGRFREILRRCILSRIPKLNALDGE